MRSDMHKVITEPARPGSYYRAEPNDYRQAKRFKLTDEQEVVDRFNGKLPMKCKMIGWDSKKHNQQLLWSVTKRFLTSNVGRRWNDVYSEISKICRTDAAKANDLKHQFTRNVEIHTYVGTDNRIYYSDDYSDYNCVEDGGCDFYIDPTDGTLQLGGDETKKCWWKVSKEARVAHSKTYREHLDGSKFEKINDVWFAIERKPVPTRQWNYDAKCYVEVILYGDVKRTASKKEIRDYALNS